MLELLLASAATAAAAEQRISAASRTTPAVAATLEAPPGVTLHYYDVGGTNLPAINASIAANAPKDRASNAIFVSSSKWNIRVRFDQKITDGRCEIIAADARFTGSVSLPRLVNAEALPREQRQVWERYVANLGSYETAKLWFVYDRIGEIDTAIMRSSCKTASQSAAAAAGRIEQELTRFARVNKKPAPTLKVPVRDPHDPQS